MIRYIFLQVFGPSARTRTTCGTINWLLSFFKSRIRDLENFFLVNFLEVTKEKRIFAART